METRVVTSHLSTLELAGQDVFLLRIFHSREDR